MLSHVFCFVLGGLLSEEVSGNLIEYSVACRTSRHKDNFSRILESTVILKRKRNVFGK